MRLPYSATRRHPRIADLDVPVTVAIDGPSGSGKSTVARTVAMAFDLAYLDTGAMFRALTWAALDAGVDLRDVDAVAHLSRTAPLHQSTDPAQPGVWVGQENVGRAIRESRISSQVSAVATNLDVRGELARRQREIIAGTHAAGRGIVAEGRDITTVIAPDARVRILLTASEEARLARRQRQTGGKAVSAATRDEVVRRDRDDSTVSNFTTAADGVTTIDTSDLDLPGSVEAVVSVVLDRAGTGSTPEGAA
ncbi:MULTISPECIES: (d)CMP kinase [Kytococcus]|uniref:(d)CMP kinase n=1 Tax=Kytococcus TaxID=57499 RepID=UPI0008A2669B|nr:MULTISPECIES: (d)CMP kinase [Kytococcus]OFS11700.1 cytidylate kinase [Kytococcus sp. HMSC28H12]